MNTEFEPTTTGTHWSEAVRRDACTKRLYFSLLRFRGVYRLAAVAITCSVLLTLSAQPSAAEANARIIAKNQDPRARALLDEAKARLRNITTLVVDFERSLSPTKPFDRIGEIVIERPNRFRIDSITGAMVERRTTLLVSDGHTVTNINPGNFIALEKPVRADDFFLGVNFLVQFFFEAQDIRFDASGASWGRPISQFDTNVSAYDRDTKLILLGSRLVDGYRCDVVEIKYNTPRNDIRQQLYIGEDKFIYQVDISIDGRIESQRFREFRVDEKLPQETWKKEKPEKMPKIEIDPVRLGAEAPDFTLPGYQGGEVKLSELLVGKKGIYICVLDGAEGQRYKSADHHLYQMRVVQELKDKFEAQGLAIVCIVGGTTITPDIVAEMKLNWMPDVTRFNYPIAIDIDLERGLQGSAFHNFQMKGRNNLLLDNKGRVVFASRNFNDKVNQLALYQAMAQIGFSISPADLDSAAK